ncbi:MAG: RluA family pseudouridine synthase [Clostridia bacterium]|nr:RluA family pseudouridine synthase [Clostridia bacterium]
MNRYTAYAPQHVPQVSLGTYVRRAFPMLPESVLLKAFSDRDVKLNGIRSRRDARIGPGDEVTVYTAFHPALPVVYQDDRILALDKPSGVGCDDDAYGSITLQQWAAMETGDGRMPKLCHRLDTQTSGLVILAWDDEMLSVMQSMFARHDRPKQYQCLVRGCPHPASRRCEAWLIKDAAHSRVRILDRPAENARPIVTEYRVANPGAISLLDVFLYTGRTHQIRAHLAHLGYPVLGDDLYGDRHLNREKGQGRLMLRSVALTLDTGGAVPQYDGMRLSVHGLEY